MQPEQDRLYVDLPPAAADMLIVDEPDRVYFQLPRQRRQNHHRTVGSSVAFPVTATRRPTFSTGSTIRRYASSPWVCLMAMTTKKHLPRYWSSPETLLRREMLQRDIFMAVAAWQLVLIAMVSVAVSVGVGHHGLL